MISATTVWYTCSSYDYIIIETPPAPSTAYLDIDLDVIIEYGELNSARTIASMTPLTFRYVHNPDLTDIQPRRVRNRFVVLFNI